MRKIKFGIIGYGFIGTRYLEKISENSQTELVAVAEIKEKKFPKDVDKSVQLVTDYHQLLANPEVEVVCVCVPNNLHKQVSIDALKAGKNVICEKPMCLTVLDANQMIMAASKTKQNLFVVKQNRFNPPVKKVKEFIDNNKLGKIGLIDINCFWNRNEMYYKSSDWKGKKSMDGGTIFTQFSHFIDIAYYLLGDIVSVTAKGFNFSHQKLIEFEDTGVVLIEFANGALGSFTYTTSAYEKNMEGSMSIFGSKGSVKIGGQYLNTIDYFSIKDISEIKLEKGNLANNYGFYQGSMSNHDKIIDNVVKTIAGKEFASTNAFEGMKVVEIIQAMYKSMATGHTIYLN
jgi:predicted dehydrogenase